MTDRMSWKSLSILLLLVGIGGCTGSAKPPVVAGSAETGGTDPEPAAPASGTNKRIIPVRRDVKEFDGNWVLLATLQGRDHFLCIVTLKKDAEGKFQGEITDIAVTDEAKSPFHAFLKSLEKKLELLSVDGNSVNLKAKSDVGVVDFQGAFDGVAIRGTLSPNPQEILASRMLPTDATKLTDYVTDAFPPAADVFMNAIKGMRNQPQPPVILKLAHEHRTSPVALEATFGLLTLNAQMGFDDATVIAIMKEYIELAKVWGPRMQCQAEFICGQQLVTLGRLPGEAIQHLDAAEKLLKDGADTMKPRIAMFREQAEIHYALQKSRSKSDEERAAAYKDLQEGLKKQPYNSDVLLALAEYAAATKQVDAAIDYYSTIVALPLLEQLVLARRAGQPAGDPTPTDVLTKLWTEKHGQADQLHAHLAKLYEDQIGSIRKELLEKFPPATLDETNDHTVLVELFTGGQNPAAISSELALDVLRETYPTSKVIALRYHQHNPGHDGLVNQDGEDRLSFYEVAKVPLVVFDGAILDPSRAPYGGYLQNTSNAYVVLRTVVDPRLKQSTPIRLELEGKVDNGELSIQAAVAGATEEQLPALRLRLALVEELVQANLPNGIRNHAMVVREMPGGARGIAPKKGELKFSFSMPASELQKHLDDYMGNYESGKGIQMPPEVKPPIRTPLYLVGWVQNDKFDNDHPDIGKAILQTAIVPVTGWVPAPPAKDTPAPETKTTAPSEESPPPPALPE